MSAPIATVKMLGIGVAILLFAYAFAISKLTRYEQVSDKYASVFGTIALALLLVATGGFTRPPANYLLEAGGYAVTAAGATAAFHRIVNNQQRFEQA